ncbi:carbohydrate ABC transporter permease [Cohnella silvisoli]|uniref:Carbohydrate ABC transporter permease n=1 Tax=Cohnella silvisoli TaxID=2873699 RepID=A0ABV1L0F4_9BACL|nr:carbohydrate ABC transporter permease [Cohnella silvisoli]MCD9025113.1 carbohydrate ABC transporter permease [Cohnella silvisoli]
MAFSNRLFSVAVYSFIAFFVVICAVPFWMVVVDSFASESSLQTAGYQLFPSEFSTYAYQYLFQGSQLWRSYSVTLVVTVVGTALSLLITSTMAYVMAHKKAKFGGLLSFMTYFTMIFGSGMVGFYILVAIWLGLKDSIWSMILPYLLNPFYAFILVAFYRTIPYEVNEAATIDGANEFTTFFRIIWPMTVPALATITLFYALQYWNDWYLAIMFVDNYHLHPLQIMIRQLIANMNMQSYLQGGNVSFDKPLPVKGVQLATVCVTIGPIILLYPFVQKYFVKGLTIGAVKG